MQLGAFLFVFIGVNKVCQDQSDYVMSYSNHWFENIPTYLAGLKLKSFCVDTDTGTGTGTGTDTGTGKHEAISKTWISIP